MIAAAVQGAEKGDTMGNSAKPTSFGRRLAMVGAAAASGAALLDAGVPQAWAQTPPAPKGYHGAPRTELYNPALTTRINATSQYKKAPPYVIGFSHAGLGNSWRVVALDELKQGA
jgi:hypothetical protein